MALFRALGSPITDVRTGEKLGRALLIPWGGKIHILGAHCQLWVATPVPQEKLIYWCQRIGFTRHPVEDIPRREPARSLLQNSPWVQAEPRVLLALLDHRAPAAVEATLQLWQQAGFSAEEIFLAYGGEEKNLASISHAAKAFILDPRLRTRMHIRQKQSYRGIFSTITEWLRGRDFTHILFVEFDQIPLVEDVGQRYLAALRQADADLLAIELRRMDQTIHPHWLGAVKQTFPSGPAWSMLGTGHFWKREAWEAVTRTRTHAEWYLELDLPTTAYELGFRMVRLLDQEPFIRDLPENLAHTPAEARAAGAWTLHPVKTTPRARQ